MRWGGRAEAADSKSSVRGSKCFWWHVCDFRASHKEQDIVQIQDQVQDQVQDDGLFWGLGNRKWLWGCLSWWQFRLFWSCWTWRTDQTRWIIDETWAHISFKITWKKHRESVLRRLSALCRLNTDDEDNEDFALLSQRSEKDQRMDWEKRKGGRRRGFSSGRPASRSSSEPLKVHLRSQGCV